VQLFRIISANMLVENLPSRFLNVLFDGFTIP
jgi:hypothetical protein